MVTLTGRGDNPRYPLPAGSFESMIFRNSNGWDMFSRSLEFVRFIPSSMAVSGFKFRVATDWTTGRRKVVDFAPFLREFSLGP